jgi:choline dehydrogenase-like flavoprotein
MRQVHSARQRLELPVRCVNRTTHRSGCLRATLIRNADKTGALEEFMIVDARSITDGATVETDVCIVGAGAAGCTLARELSGQPFRVCLIESGGLRMDPETQLLAEGEVTGDLTFPLDETRVRGFGGTTAIWAGSCRPLDDTDFQVHHWIPFSGWPFSRAHLEPYYARAQTVCQIGPPTYEVEDWEDPEAPRLPLNPERIATHIFQISPPTRFGKTYREAIHRAPNVTMLSYGNVLEVETSENARTATLVRVATLRGTVFTVRARLFVLAGGGVENPRLLLLSNRTKRVGLGNDHDLVGRFFIDHMRIESAELCLVDPRTHMRMYGVHSSRQGMGATRVEGLLSVADAVLEKEQITPNFIHQASWPCVTWCERRGPARYRTSGVPDCIACLRKPTRLR